MSQIQEIDEIQEEKSNIIQKEKSQIVREEKPNIIQEEKTKIAREEKTNIVQEEKSNTVQFGEKQSILSYASCRLCPRECKVNRFKGERGFCHAGSIMHIGRAAPHFWEEPCLSGSKGSGTIFFSYCSLSCVFCQNQRLSRGEIGEAVSVEELYQHFLSLEKLGCHNINLVTGEHYLPGILEAIRLAKKRGFSLPFVWNCSGYQSSEVLASCEGLINIYLFDFKYIKEDTALRYSKAKDYPMRAKEALAECMRQCPELEYKEGLLQKGVILRHLLLPNQVYQAKKVLKYAYEEYGENILYSLLRQYIPYGNLEAYPEIDRRVYGKEYEKWLSYAENLGIQNAYIQEAESAKESFIPEFTEKRI